VREAIFTPDGTRLITASADDTVRVWEMPSGKPVGQPLRHDLPGEPTIEHLAVSPDGTRILSVCGDHTARVWEASPVQPFGERVEGAGTHERGKIAVMANPDGTRTASLTDDRTVQLRDAKKDEPIGEPLRHREDVKNIAFSPDGALLVTACADGTARLWDAATGAPASEPMRQEFDARTTFMPDGRQLASETEHSRRLREAPPAFAEAAAAPESFIEALTGYRFSPDGVLRELSAADLAGLRARLRDDRAGDSAWRPLIDWWLTPRQTRTLSPGSKMTRRELADRELASRDRDAILNAYLLDPTHPLVHLALASLDDYEPRTNFLRAFALQRLPTDAAIRARAAQMLREQGRAQQAARVESAKP
jgi:hypothetical protein